MAPIIVVVDVVERSVMLFARLSIVDTSPYVRLPYRVAPKQAPFTPLAHELRVDG